MFSGLNVENLTKLGVITESTKDEVIKKFINAFSDYCYAHLDEYGSMKMGELRVIRNGLEKYLQSKPLRILLRYTLEDVTDIVTDIELSKVLDYAKTISPLFKEIIDSEPTFQEDKYYFEYNAILDLIATLTKAERDECGCIYFDFLALHRLDLKNVFGKFLIIKFL